MRSFRALLLMAAALAATTVSAQKTGRIQVPTPAPTPTAPAKPSFEKPAYLTHFFPDISIARFEPPKAAAGSSQKVTLYGGGFNSCRQFQIFFTGASGRQDVVALPSARTDTAIDVSPVPSGARTGKVSFVCQDPARTVLSASNFVVPENITLTAVKPGRAARGTPVTIHGTKFSQWDSFEVRFPVSQFASWPPGSALPVKVTKFSDTSFEVVVPASASSGVLQVSGRLTGSQATTFVQSTFSLDVPVPVVATGFDRTSAQPGRSMKVLGSGFLNQPEFAAFFTGAGGQTTEAAPIQPGTRFDSEVMLTVPGGARTGPVRVVVGTGAATQSATTAASFGIPGPLQVRSIQPLSGPRGSTVTISGSGFLNRSVVTVDFWNGQGLSNQNATISTKSDDTLTVLVPDGTRGTGKLQVTSGVGTDFEIVRSTQDFTLIPDALAVTDVQPRSARPGASLAISGQFRDYMSVGVLFADASGAATQGGLVTSRASSSLAVTVPSGAAGTGKILLVGELGPESIGFPRTDRVTSTQDFTVVRDAVQINGFAPGSGPANSRVDISGRNFQNPYSLDVFFPSGGGYLKAPLVTRSDSALTVAVPTGAAGTGKILVVVGPERVQSSQDFQVTP